MVNASLAKGVSPFPLSVVGLPSTAIPERPAPFFPPPPSLPRRRPPARMVVVDRVFIPFTVAEHRRRSLVACWSCAPYFQIPLILPDLGFLYREKGFFLLLVLTCGHWPLLRGPLRNVVFSVIGFPRYDVPVSRRVSRTLETHGSTYLPLPKHPIRTCNAFLAPMAPGFFFGVPPRRLWVLLFPIDLLPPDLRPFK